MATTEFDIISRATTRLGALKVSSYDDDTREAEVAEQLYEINVTNELASGYWNFAKKTFELSRDTASPTDPNYTYQFQLPSDLVQVEFAMDETGTTVDYVIEGDKLLSDATRVFLKYDRRPDESTWPVYFQETIAARLAWQFAEPLSPEAGVRDRCKADYEWQVKQARRIDAQATPPVQIISAGSADWVGGRLGF